MKELFSERVAAGSRTYFFDVKESAEGVRYMVISESKPKDAGFEHHRVMVFEEHLEKFSEVFDQAVWMMAKRDIYAIPSDVDLEQREKHEQAKAYHLDEIKQAHPRAYEKWTAEEDERLKRQYQSGLDIPTLATMFQRQPSAIRSRLNKLGLG